MNREPLHEHDCPETLVLRLKPNAHQPSRQEVELLLSIWNEVLREIAEPDQAASPPVQPTFER